MRLFDKKRTASGTVLDEKGEAFIGVFVVVKGTSNGTMTDENGHFSITLENGGKLEFSFIGYENKTLDIGSRNDIAVTMSPVSTTLEESTVVAYGTQRKASIIGSISTISADDLKTPVANISNALAGRMPGVVAMQTSSEPGSSSEFWIRG